MSDGFFDTVFPPKQSDFAIVPIPEDDELDEDNLVPEGYDYDTHLTTWVCKTCGAAVTNTTLHTEWHDQLLGSLDRDATRR